MKIFSGILIGAAFCLFSFSCGESDDHSNEAGRAAMESHISNYNGKDKSINFPDAKEWRSNWSKENVLVIQIGSEPDNLHPTNGNNANRAFIFMYTHRFLIEDDMTNLDIRPSLVKTMPEVSSDQLKYTFELRDEPAFDDGSQVSVEDVIFSYKSAQCELTDDGAQKPNIDNLIDIQKDPDNLRRFTFVMKRKYIKNIELGTNVAIIERKVFDPDNVLAKYSFKQLTDSTLKHDAPKDLTAWAKFYNDKKFGFDPQYLSGLGAYQVSEWDKGQKIVLVKKKDHWTKNVKDPSIYETAFPKKIIFRVISDPNAVALELKNQSIDGTTIISTQALMELGKDKNFNKNYNYVYADQYAYSYMGMNMKPDEKHKPLFTDKKVRRAIAMLTPIDDIINTLINGKAQRIATMVCPLKAECDLSLTLIPFDIEGAKKLLSEAGWKDSDGDNILDKAINGKNISFEFDLIYPQGNKVTDEMVEMIKESYYKAGIVVNLRAMDTKILQKHEEDHDFDMYVSGWSSGSRADDFKQIWHTESYDGGSNFVGFGNAETDALIDSARFTVDPAQRLRLVKKFQQAVYDEQPYVFLYRVYRKTVLHKRFGNQIATYERPGVILNNLKLLSGLPAAKE